MDTKDLAIAWLKQDEGLVLHPYKCTADKTSIGYGRNLEDCGINQDEADLMLQNDYQTARLDAISYLGTDGFTDLSETQRAVIVCMAFNLGLTRLRKFVKLKAALLEGDYAEANYQMLDSKWAKQVGARSHRLANFILVNDR